MKTKSSITVLLIFFLLLTSFNQATPQEPPPKKDAVVLLACIAVSIILIEATYVVVKTYNSCLPKTNGVPNQLVDENPMATMHFQQSSNMVNWQTFQIVSAPAYGCVVTNHTPLNPIGYVRVVAYPF